MSDRTAILIAERDALRAANAVLIQALAEERAITLAECQRAEAAERKLDDTRAYIEQARKLIQGGK